MTELVRIERQLPNGEWELIRHADKNPDFIFSTEFYMQQWLHPHEKLREVVQSVWF